MRIRRLFLFVGLVAFSQMAVARASSVFKTLDLKINARPDIERVEVLADLNIELAESNTGEVELIWQMTKPTKIAYFIDADSGEQIEYRFQKIPNVPDSIGIQQLLFKLPPFKKNRRLKISYLYDGNSFSGWAQNPATHDNLHLGQITKTS